MSCTLTFVIIFVIIVMMIMMIMMMIIVTINIYSCPHPQMSGTLTFVIIPAQVIMMKIFGVGNNHDDYVDEVDDDNDDYNELTIISSCRLQMLQSRPPNLWWEAST